ncbi:MAG TPA: CPBP family intramembrane glutamic endopeptidase [Conexivisphaerales archaeon]|nr:CPBP family intramembrane glutamic endopeptidase [Conexivisphaerales archaeon]
MSSRPSAAVGGLFVFALTVLLILLNRDAQVLTLFWKSFGPYVDFVQQMMGYIVIACLGAFAMRAEGIKWGDLGLSRNNLLLSLPLLAVFFAGNVALVYAAGGWSQAFRPVVAGLPLWAVAASIIIVAFTEEFVFRGFVQIGTARRFGITQGILVSAMVFSLVHVPTDLAGVAPGSDATGVIMTLAMAAVGRFLFSALAFSYMYQFTGNLYITIMTHAFYDFSLTYLVVTGGTLTIVLLYLVVPYIVVLTVYYSAPFRGLLRRPAAEPGRGAPPVS